MRIVAYNDDLKEQVIRFLRRIWLELGRPWDSDGREKDFFAIPQTYQAAGGEFWVALNDEDEAIGTIALVPINQDEVELARLYLDQNYRGRGLGRDLVQLVISKAKEKGFKVIKLDTSKKLARAYDLFRKMGFRVTKPCIDDEHPEVFMELNMSEDK